MVDATTPPTKGNFRFDEKYLSQVPAIQVLVNLGAQYLTPAEALATRGGKAGNVLPEEILRESVSCLLRLRPANEVPA